MRILIFRHAERENSAMGNPPLSSRGHQQAEKLADLIVAGQLPPPTKLLASPRLRSQQTFLKTADKLGLELSIIADLDERQNSETLEQFQKRIKRFLFSLENSTGTVYLCSHLDWLEEAMYLIPSETDLAHEKYQIWAPCHFMDFEMQDGLWTLHNTGGVNL